MFPATFYLVNLCLDTCHTLIFCFPTIDILVSVINEQSFPQVFTLGWSKAIEAVEIDIIVFCDDLLNKSFLRLSDSSLRTFPYQHDKVLQESCLFHVQLLTLDAEWIHGDGMFFCIADILTAYIFT